MERVDFDLKRVKLYEEIADRLEKTIISSADNLGQKLPSEQELAKSFGVSRNIVRESFKLLKERGLITLRTGEVAYISKPESYTLANLISRMLAMDNIDTQMVYEMRLLLETDAARLAADRATSSEIDELEAINQEMEQHHDDMSIRIQLDVDFHKQLGDMSGNRLLSLFVSAMTDLRRAMIHQAIQTGGGSLDGIFYHAKIVKALRAHDGQDAEILMRNHLSESLRRYRIIQGINCE